MDQYRMLRNNIQEENEERLRQEELEKRRLSIQKRQAQEAAKAEKIRLKKEETERKKAAAEQAKKQELAN